MPLGILQRCISTRTQKRLRAETIDCTLEKILPTRVQKKISGRERNCTFQSVPPFQSVPVLLMSCFSCLNSIFRCDFIYLALHFAAKPALIAIAVVGSLTALAILVIVAIFAYLARHINSNQASFSNGKVSYLLRLLYTFRGDSRPSKVARPVRTVSRYLSPFIKLECKSWLSNCFEVKWIVECFTTSKCERPNHLFEASSQCWRQRGRVVRASDLKSVGHVFRSRSDH